MIQFESMGQPIYALNCLEQFFK